MANSTDASFLLEGGKVENSGDMSADARGPQTALRRQDVPSGYAELQREREAREACERLGAAMKIDYETIEQALHAMERSETQGNPRSILEIVKQRLGALCCYLCEWDLANDKATVKRNWVTADDIGEGPWSLDVSDWRPKFAAHASRKAMRYGREAAADIFLRHFGGEVVRRSPLGGAGCLYAVPIAIGVRMWGSLCVAFADDRDLSQSEESTLRRLSEVFSIAHERDSQYLRLRSAVADQTLSTITKQLYGYDLTVDLASNTFSIVTGSGMDALVRRLETVGTYREACEIMIGLAKPEFRDRLRKMISLDYLLNAAEAEAEHEAFEYGLVIDGEERWTELNVVIAREGGDRSVVNILGRDITEARKVQLNQERELKAAVVKDQILSGITQTLYGFNITARLKDDSYTLIRGTGTDLMLRVLAREGLSYSQAIEDLIAFVPQKDKVRCRKFVGRDYLLGLRGKSGYIGTDTFEHASSDGVLRWCEVNVFMGADENGDPVANILGRDVTESHRQQVRRERELKAAAAKDQILSGITQALYGYNLTVNLKTLKYTLITGTGMDAACEVFKQHDDYADALAEKLKFVAPQYAPHVASILAPEHLSDLADSGRNGAMGSFEYAAIVNGRHQWHETNIFIGTDENGDPVANILGRNITDSHEQLERRERELKAAAAKDQILSGITQALYGYNLTVNLKTLKYTLITGTGLDAACEVFKQHDDYADALAEKLKFVDVDYGPRVLDILSPDRLRQLAASGQSGAVGSFEYAATVNGESQWHETNVFIGTDENGDPVANILGRDITEIHRQVEMRQQLQVAQQSNAAKTSFLFSMSHDIRTPMNAILGFVAMARNLAGEDRRLQECLGKIDLAGNHLLSLINAVLEMSRIESGTIVMRPRVCDIVEQARMMKTVAESNAEKRGVRLTLTVAEVAHPHVNADIDRVNQIVQNILGNAIKYTPCGGHVDYELSERPLEAPGRSLYVIKVADNGIGMSAEFQKKIFEPFSREQTSTASGIEGTGLGMSIVRRLLDMMGGTIDIVSAPNEGTTVTVGLAFSWEAQPEAPAEKQPVREDFRLTGRRILLVEDNEMNREIASWMLKEMGAEVVEATNGKEAVDVVESGAAIDLVLMDVQMPVMNGHEATKAIRKMERGRNLPIIALSANAFEEDRKRSREIGMDDHIAKPIKVDEMVSTLRRYLDVAKGL